MAVATGAAAPELQELVRQLPHRYPFLLIDRVLEISDRHVLTLKNVTNNEPFFVGHFPGRPVMPGVLVIEALAQSAAIFAMHLAPDGVGGLFMLTGLDKVRLRRPVVPGDQLKIEVKLLRHHRPLWKMHAEANVDGELAAEADLSAMEVPEELR